MSTGVVACAAIIPAVKSSVSPGRKGNSRPVSMKMMTITPTRTAEPNTPPLPSQYIGSISAGSAITEATPGQVTAATFPVGELDANVVLRVTSLPGRLRCGQAPDRGAGGDARGRQTGVAGGLRRSLCPCFLVGSWLR